MILWAYARACAPAQRTYARAHKHTHARAHEKDHVADVADGEDAGGVDGLKGVLHLDEPAATYVDR
jgi:hypothetical protein